jgi:RNA polymerase sigma-70 factor (ECF subfamily)
MNDTLVTEGQGQVTEEETPDTKRASGLAASDELLTPQQLYDRAAEQVNRLVRRLIGPDPDQDDLVNEVFLRMLRNIETLRDPTRFHGWVNRVTVNTVRDWLRKRKVRRRHQATPRELDELVGSTAASETRYLAIRTLRLLDRLPVDQRLAFSIRHLDQLPLPQVAELCDCSLATIKRRLAKAEKRFYALARRDPLLCELLEQGRLGGGGERP